MSAARMRASAFAKLGLVERRRIEQRRRIVTGLSAGHRGRPHLEPGFAQRPAEGAALVAGQVAPRDADRAGPDHRMTCAYPCRPTDRRA